MATITILGAGGKMGCRLTDHLCETDHQLLLVEVGEAGKQNIAQRGLSTTPRAEALRKALDAAVRRGVPREAAED